MDPQTIDREESFWRTQYRSRPYVAYGAKVDDYLPAYRYGIDARIQFPDRSFNDIAEILSQNWPRARGKSSLKWSKAKLAAEDSWTRLGQLAAQKAAEVFAVKDE